MAFVALLSASCGVPRDSHPRPISDDKVPFELLDPRPATTAPVTTPVPRP
jgi:hypothetical protein